MLGVTRIDEALTLRDGGIDTPILVMAPILPANAEIAVSQDLTCTVDSLELAQALGAAARRQEKKAQIHVKVDTGMGRLGLLPENVVAFFRALAEIYGVTVTGVFTHFATATEPDLATCRKQLIIFKETLAHLQSQQLDAGLAHAANSAATLRLPEAHLDMVRVGTLLYGQYPSSIIPRSLDLQKTWELKARVIAVREVPSGVSVGYGAEYTTKRPTRAAVLPIGYADGFTLIPDGPLWRQSPLKLLARKYKRSLTVTIQGKPMPVIGRVSMQITVVDVTDLPNVTVGDEATIPALRLAAGGHIPRIYKEKGPAVIAPSG
jgi:alanine racemase